MGQRSEPANGNRLRTPRPPTPSAERGVPPGSRPHALEVTYGGDRSCAPLRKGRRIGGGLAVPLRDVVLRGTRALGGAGAGAYGATTSSPNVCGRPRNSRRCTSTPARRRSGRTSPSILPSTTPDAFIHPLTGKCPLSSRLTEQPFPIAACSRQKATYEKAARSFRQ